MLRILLGLKNKMAQRTFCIWIALGGFFDRQPAAVSQRGWCCLCLGLAMARLARLSLGRFFCRQSGCGRGCPSLVCAIRSRFATVGLLVFRPGGESARAGLARMQHLPGQRVPYRTSPKRYRPALNQRRFRDGAIGKMGQCRGVAVVHANTLSLRQWATERRKRTSEGVSRFFEGVMRTAFWCFKSARQNALSKSAGGLPVLALRQLRALACQTQRPAWIAYQKTADRPRGVGSRLTQLDAIINELDLVDSVGNTPAITTSCSDLQSGTSSRWPSWAGRRGYSSFSRRNCQSQLRGLILLPRGSSNGTSPDLNMRLNRSLHGCLTRFIAFPIF